MKRLIISLLVGAALIAGCASSTGTNHQPTPSQPLTTTRSQNISAADVFDAMGSREVARECKVFTDGISAGATPEMLYQAFAQGYDAESLPGNPPSARAMFNEFLSRC